MEEQLRETFDANTEDLLKENIELKVAVEELKNELVYKTDLLTQASKAMQQMSVGEGDDLSMTQQRYDQSLSKMRSDYERKLIVSNRISFSFLRKRPLSLLGHVTVGEKVYCNSNLL